MIKGRFLGCAGMLSASALLVACQSSFNHQTGVFRNREFDYLHQSVEHRPPLVIPPSVDSPQLSPKNTLPPGPDFYSAEKSVNMTPPGFDEVQTSKETSAPTTKLPSKLPAHLSFDAQHVGLLQINAPFKESWDAVTQAIQSLGYSISKVDSGSHLIYVDVPNTHAPQKETQTFLLYLNRKDNSTQVSVFTDKGILDSSDAASSLLTQLQVKL